MVKWRCNNVERVKLVNSPLLYLPHCVFTGRKYPCKLFNPTFQQPRRYSRAIYYSSRNRNKLLVNSWCSVALLRTIHCR